jgi:hypothetical protein
LPPIEIETEFIDLRAFAGGDPGEHYLFPCRGSGILPHVGNVGYLDERPSRKDWLLIGCARSREIYRWIYGAEPRNVDICPRRQMSPSTLPTLIKCCLLEHGVHSDGPIAAVPWGANIDEVRQGLDILMRANEAAWPAG